MDDAPGVAFGEAACHHLTPSGQPCGGVIGHRGGCRERTVSPDELRMYVVHLQRQCDGLSKTELRHRREFHRLAVAVLTRAIGDYHS